MQQEIKRKIEEYALTLQDVWATYEGFCTYDNCDTWELSFVVEVVLSATLGL